MGPVPRRFTIGVVLFLGAIASHPAAATGRDPIVIAIKIKDYAGVPSSVRETAQAEAARVYAAIGVNVLWQFSPAADEHEPAASTANLRVNILSPAMTRRLTPPPDAAATAPRTREKCGRVAYVFYDRVQQIAQGHLARLGLLLGLVIAHETGHLLLPFNSHSPFGIMRAAWDRDQMRRGMAGDLQFTPSQGDQIRSYISRTFHAKTVGVSTSIATGK